MLKVANYITATNVAVVINLRIVCQNKVSWKINVPLGKKI